MAQLPTLTNTIHPRRAGYDVILDTLLLRLATAPDRQVRIDTAPAQAQRIQTEQTSEDFLPEFGAIYSRNNFTGGEGLDFAYRTSPGENDRRRFWDSQGVDVSVTQPGVVDGVTLLRDTQLSWASTDDHLPMARALDGTLYYGEGNVVFEIPNPGASSPTRNSEDPDAGGTNTVLDLATHGDEVYVSLGAGKIARRNSAGSWAVLASAPTSVKLWAVKDRIISDNGTGIVAVISEVDGTPTTLHTLDTGVVVNSIIDAGAVILMATSDGQVHAFTEDSGSLVLASQNTLTNVDVVTAMAHVAGTLVLGTWDGTWGRIWRAQVGDANAGFAITGAQLLKETSYKPTAAGAARDAAYVGVRRSSTEVELWRFDLATGGLSRHLVAAASGGGFVSDIASVGGRIYAAVTDAGVFRTGDTYVAQGYVISAMADFYSPAEKAWVGITVQADQLSDGQAAVDIFVSTDTAALLDPDSTSWVLVGRINSPDDTGGEFFLPDVRGRYCGVQLRLVAGSSDTTTPRLISFALRAYTASRDLVVSMPVNVSDQIEIPGRKPFRSQGWGERMYGAILGYHGQTVDLEIFEPEMVLRGVVEEVGLPVPAVSRRGSSTLYSLVTFRGRIVLPTTTQAGEGNLGVVLAGVHLAGT